MNNLMPVMQVFEGSFLHGPTPDLTRIGKFI